jgi:hypothetical protein
MRLVRNRLPDRLRLPLTFDPERLAAGMANFSLGRLDRAFYQTEL